MPQDPPRVAPCLRSHSYLLHNHRRACNSLTSQLELPHPSRAPLPVVALLLVHSEECRLHLQDLGGSIILWHRRPPQWDIRAFRRHRRWEWAPCLQPLSRSHMWVNIMEDILLPRNRLQFRTLLSNLGSDLVVPAHLWDKR